MRFITELSKMFTGRFRRHGNIRISHYPNGIIRCRVKKSLVIYYGAAANYTRKRHGTEKPSRNKNDLWRNRISPQKANDSCSTVPRYFCFLVFPISSPCDKKRSELEKHKTIRFPGTIITFYYYY